MDNFVMIVAIVVAFVGFANALPTEKQNAHVGLEVQPNSPENLAKLASGHYQENIEQLSGQFEGDMVLTETQKMLIQGVMDTIINERTGLINETYRWPNNTVPVLLSANQFDADQEAHVYKGLRTLESISCLKFVNRTTEENYVLLTTNGSGCYSNVGHLGLGEQSLNLQSYPIEQGCFRLGTIMHEFLHTLGFYHMQSATERDDFVRIAWENLVSGTENNFQKYEADRISNFGQLYDVTSVMHYGAYGFSKNGFATIIPNNITLINVMGQRAALSVLDIARLNAMYKCAA